MDRPTKLFKTEEEKTVEHLIDLPLNVLDKFLFTYITGLDVANVCRIYPKWCNDHHIWSEIFRRKFDHRFNSEWLADLNKMPNLFLLLIVWNLYVAILHKGEQIQFKRSTIVVMNVGVSTTRKIIFEPNNIDTELETFFTNFNLKAVQPKPTDLIPVPPYYEIDMSDVRVREILYKLFESGWRWIRTRNLAIEKYPLLQACIGCNAPTDTMCSCCNTPYCSIKCQQLNH